GPGSKENPHGPHEPKGPVGPHRGPRSIARRGALAWLDAAFVPSHLPRIARRCSPTRRPGATRTARPRALRSQGDLGSLHSEAVAGHGPPLGSRILVPWP